MMFNQIRKINQKILQQDNDEKNDSGLEVTSLNFRPTANDAKLALSETDELSSSQKKWVQYISQNYSKKKLEDLIPTNKERAFLIDLKLSQNFSQNSFQDLKKRHHISENELSKLQNNKCLSLTSDQEELFLRTIGQCKKLTLKKINKIQIEHGISQAQLKNLKNRGHIDYLENKDDEGKRFHSSQLDQDFPIKVKEVASVNYYEKNELKSYRMQKKEKIVLPTLKKFSYERKSLVEMFNISESLDEFKNLSPQEKKEFYLQQNTGNREALRKKMLPNNLYFKLQNDTDSLSCNEKKFLKNEGYLDYLEPEEEAIRQKYYKNKSLSYAEFRTLEDMEKRSFVHISTKNESKFLKEIESQTCLEDSPDFQIILNKYEISEDKFTRMKEKGLVDIMSNNSMQWIQNGAHFNQLEKFDLKKSDYKKLKNRINDNQIDTQIRIARKNQQTMKITYFEPEDLLKDRIQWSPLKNKTHLSPEDRNIILTGNFSEMNSKQAHLFYELKTRGHNLNNIYLPTNKEILFLNKINNRKSDNELIQKIGIEDFQLTQKQISDLEKMNFYTQNDKIKNNYKEPIELSQLRYKAIQSPENSPQFLSNKIDTSPKSYKIKATDYYLFFKIRQNKTLNYSEQNREKEILLSGYNPRSDEFKKEILKERKGWRLEHAQKNALLNYFKEEKKVNIDALKFVNTFKQVSKAQLYKIGLTPQEIDLYVNGVDSKNEFSKDSKLLNEERLMTPKGPIKYYSINHNKQISGRRYLEQIIDSNKISKQPQKRDDLKYHDIRVVDSFLMVKNELKNKGYKIKDVVTESKQYSLDKAGKQNNQRQKTQSFMDVNIVIETNEKEEKLQGSSGKSKVIAVEYGNYPPERMAEKIENSDFDTAYIYSRSDYCQIYKQHIKTHKNVHFRSI